MNHEEDKDQIESDDSDQLVVESDDDNDSQQDEEGRILKTLLIKKGPTGYTVQKGRKIKKPDQNETKGDHPNVEASNQPSLYRCPKVKNQSLTQEELSSIYTKYIEQSPYFVNSLQNIIPPQENTDPQSSGSNIHHLTRWQVETTSEALTSNQSSEMKLSTNADQDPLVDSTNQTEESDYDEPSQSNVDYDQSDNPILISSTSDIEDSPIVMMEDNVPFIFPDEIMAQNFNTVTLPSPSEFSKKIDNLQVIKGKNIQEFDFIKLEKLDSKYEIEDRPNPQLDSVLGDRSLGGCSYIKKDCFFGGKAQYLSGLDGFQFKDQIQEECLEVQYEEPMLERLFSNISDASQASTKTADSDQTEFSDLEKDNEENAEKQKDPDLEENSNILEDGSILVVNRSDSDVHVVGYS